jgi:N-acyl amino acid synthase of PEP-CTERM/exosortase system
MIHPRAPNDVVPRDQPACVEFAPHFEAARARPEVDAGVMQAIYALRFEVYCVECGFLAAEAYPNRLESDSADPVSSHFYATDRRGQLAGYVRLVPADAAGRFPFEKHCTGLFRHVQLQDPSACVEISRLMVQAHYRRRRGDNLAGMTVPQDGGPPALERRNDSPQIMLSLFRQMYVHCLGAGVRYWYAAMERPLARALARLGFCFDAIGPETDYYGPVAPYLADLRRLESSVGASRPDLLRWMRAPLDER